jgi:hypothetical protein
VLSNADRLQRLYIENDHAEALAIERQLAVAPAGVSAQHVIDLNRFCETTEDDGSYDVPKERMRALKAAGLVSGGQFGWYFTTDVGLSIRDAWFDLAEDTP